MRIRLDNQGSVRDTSSAGLMRAGRAIEFAVLFMVALSLVMTAPATAAPPGDWFESQKLMPPDLSAGDTFGGDIVVEGDRALIGSIFKNGSGEVYDYRRDPETGRWELRGRLAPPEPEVGDLFGSHISISGDWALVGAYGAENGTTVNAGAAFVFQFFNDAWAYQSRIDPIDPEAHANFSNGLEIHGNWAFIGARYKDDADFDSGAVYAYRLDFWNFEFQYKLEPGYLSQDYYFGTSIDATDEWVIVGATGDSVLGSNAGAVFFFRRSGDDCIFDSRHDASTTEAGDAFGQEVHFEGERVLIGAQFAEEAYLFEYDGDEWRESAVFTPGDGVPGDQFGSACTLDGDTVVIGSVLHDEGRGAVYVFTPDGESGWNEQKLVASDREPDDWFGQILDVEGDTIIVSALNDDNEYGTDAGADYVFTSGGTFFGLIVDPDPLRGREPGVFEITDARPERKTWLLYSFDGEGMTYIPQLKVAVDLAYPRIGFGPKATDEVGYVAWMYFIPGVGQPVDIWFQAVQKRATSNVIATQIVP